MAHPGVASYDAKKLCYLADCGLRGIEVYHPMHSKSQVGVFLAAAKEFGLFVTGGSDYHGPKSGRDELVYSGLSREDLNGFFEAIS